LYVTTTSGEGFGLPPVESLACGVPAIVPENSTGPEVLGLEEPNNKPMSGFHFAKGGLITCCPFRDWVGNGLMQEMVTVENTYKAIKFLYNDPDLRIRMGKNGREYVEKMFNLETFKKKWLDIINTTKKKKFDEEFKKIEMEEENGQSSERE